MNRRYWSGYFIDKLKDNEILVFGSNPEGRHGMGAAKVAQRYGAVYGEGYGLHGQTYAIVTKNLTAGYECPIRNVLFDKAKRRSVSPAFIEMQIAELYEYAKAHPELDFLVVYRIEYYHNGIIKASLCGYNGIELRDMFFHVVPPDNIIFHDSFKS